MASITRRQRAVQAKGPMAGSFKPQIEVLEDRTLLSVTLVDIGTLGGDVSVPYSINDKGQVAGFSNLYPGGPNHAFIWDEVNGMRDLGVLPGGTQSGAYGINELGQVVGASQSAKGTHAFVWDEINGMQDLGTLWDGQGRCNAWGINDLGQIVGSCIAPDEFQEEHTVAVIWQGGNEIMKIPNQWGTEYSYAYDINNFGEITGWAINDQGEPNAYLYVGGINGTMVNLGTLGGPNSKGYRLNMNHQLVGAASESGRYDKAFYYNDGVMNNIPTLGGAFNYAYGINDAGWVVGKSFTNPPNIHAYVFIDGNVIDLNDFVEDSSTSGWRALTEAKDINNHNQITGWGRRWREKHGYVMTLTFDEPTNAIGTAVIPTTVNHSPEVHTTVFDTPLNGEDPSANLNGDLIIQHRDPSTLTSQGDPSLAGTQHVENVEVWSEVVGADAFSIPLFRLDVLA